MIVCFKTEFLKKLATQNINPRPYSKEVIKAYRKKIGIFKQTKDLNVLYTCNSLNLKILQGNYKGYYSVRINKQWRIIFSAPKEGGSEIIYIQDIVDYHK